MEWQLIDTAPKDGTYIFIATESDFIGEARWVNSFAEVYSKIYGHIKTNWYCPKTDSPIYPTHWMPLPEPPK